MANVLFKRGSTATINSTAISDGQLLYNTTTGQHYIDSGSTRKEVGKPVDTTLSTTSTNAIANNALTNSIINTTAEVSAITADNIPCGTKPVKELINSLTIHSTTFDNVFSHLVGDYVINNESDILYLYKFNTAGVPITNATKVLGGVGVILNADGKAYVMGADSVLKKCSGRDACANYEGFGVTIPSNSSYTVTLVHEPKSVFVIAQYSTLIYCTYKDFTNNEVISIDLANGNHTLSFSETLSTTYNKTNNTLVISNLFGSAFPYYIYTMY